MESETQVIQAIRIGDEQAFRRLYGQFYNYLMVVGLRYLTDRLRVEDVIQDVFLDIWNKRADLNITTGIKSYLRGAVSNKCLAILRKDKRMDYVYEHAVDLADDKHQISHQMDAALIQQTVKEALESMPPKRKNVFILSREKGLSNKEVAKKLDVSVKTVENHMTLVLKTLRLALKKKGLLSLVFIFYIFWTLR